jgi:alkanesulfonate monooxygenase SsuD/methylene tetrahydromethanopterin reductase-like flavin-dependent oxidoreductase (luciferase family)
MQFGLFGGANAPRGLRTGESERGYHDFIEAHIEAEALGYHSSFVTEHHFTGIGQVSATLTLLAWIGARTSTLRLGTAILVLPWHNPVLLAEQAATVDLLTGGRLDLGVGKGYRHTEFAGFAIPPDEAEPRFAEALGVMVRALSSDARFSHHGRFWTFDDIVVEPPPHQRPHPPIWLAAGASKSIADCAARDCNLLLNQFASPAEVGEKIGLYRQALATAGRRFDPLRVGVARNLWVARDAADKAAAIERQAALHARLGRLSTGSQSRGSHILAYSGADGGREAHSLIGTPDEIADKLAELSAAGVAYVLLNGHGDRDNFRRFAEQVMPAFNGSPLAGP